MDNWAFHTMSSTVPACRLFSQQKKLPSRNSLSFCKTEQLCHAILARYRKCCPRELRAQYSKLSV